MTVDRPKNREVEDEMVRKPNKDGDPPRPATEPVDGDSATGREPKPGTVKPPQR